MPTLSRWAIKLALIHFAGGIALGGIMLAAKAGWGDLGMLNHRAVHIHMLLFGWTIQLVYGVAYWILPKFSTGDRHGSSALAIAAVVAINLGALCGTAEPWVAVLGAVGWGLETLSAVLFALHGWPRIKGFGS